MENTRRKRRSVNIDEKIEKTRNKLEEARSRCEKIEAEYKALLARRDESRRKKLMDALAKSRRTFDEVMNFIKG